MTPIAVSGACVMRQFLPAVTPRAVSGEDNVALFLRRMGRVLLVLGAVLDCTPLVVPREQF